MPDSNTSLGSAGQQMGDAVENTVGNAGNIAANTLSQGGNIGSSFLNTVESGIDSEKKIVDEQLMNVLHSAAKVEMANNFISCSASLISLILGIIIGYIICRTMK